MKLITSKAAIEAPEQGRRMRQFEERQARMDEAKAAADRRAARGRTVNSSMVARVSAAQKALERPLSKARELLDDLSPSDLQVYLLAEELGQNRKGILQGFPPAARSVREAYEQESGPVAPSADSKE